VDDEIRRGDIWWADLEEPEGSEPGYRRPVLVVQANGFNQSMMNTVIVVALIRNMMRVGIPGNVLVSKRKTGLSHDSVVNLTQISAQDKSILTQKCGQLDPASMGRVAEGMRLVLGL
jgi:mRNA interferase MazF